MTSFLYIFTDSLLSFFFLICQVLAARAGGLKPLGAFGVIFCKRDFVLFCNAPLPGAGKTALNRCGFMMLSLARGLRVILQYPLAKAKTEQKNTPPFRAGCYEHLLAALKHTLLVFVEDTVVLRVGGMDDPFTHKFFVYFI